LVFVCLADEVGPVSERPDQVELVLHQAVDGLDVGSAERVCNISFLPRAESRKAGEAVGAGRNGFVTLAGDGLDRLGEGARIFCPPGADEFRAVVGLPGGAPEFNAAFFEALDNLFGEDLGACKAQFVAESREPAERDS